MIKPISVSLSLNRLIPVSIPIPSVAVPSPSPFSFHSRLIPSMVGERAIVSDWMERFISVSSMSRFVSFASKKRCIFVSCAPRACRLGRRDCDGNGPLAYASHLGLIFVSNTVGIGLLPFHFRRRNCRVRPAGTNPAGRDGNETYRFILRWVAMRQPNDSHRATVGSSWEAISTRRRLLASSLMKVISLTASLDAGQAESLLSISRGKCPLPSTM